MDRATVRAGLVFNRRKMTEQQESSNKMKSHTEEKKDMGYYFNFSEVLGYYFRKKDPNRPTNTSLKMMHGINKISIIMFLICLIVIVGRFIIRAF